MINEVTFDNISFNYEPNVPVLQNISFSLKQNMKLALVGPTGAGKSTIINLLARFYDPNEGAILIDGHNIRNIKLASLRSHIGIVLQDSFLFPISIRENIRFAKPEASDAEIISAAKSVGAHDFIMKLPNDYGYQVQEGSSNISIGQRQLISFARTLVANPEILVLDEATSSVDAYTELVIQNALKVLMQNRMTIIIAHRLSTVRLCDQILILDHGSIVERGTHEELMHKKGLYSSFYKLQFREENGVDKS
ncbi:MAG TPA: ATP-binding cassette domain-containing protein [Candidatus Sulfotelmatobacter sp.]|nr:ATP-binding cassette domain-containing protein [Candidatus Sulfotelmatobacter sp.]